MQTKKKIIEYLKQNTNFDEVDSYLVDELLYNDSLMKQAKKDIKDRGIQINVSNNPDKPYFQTNQAITLYNNSLKNVLQISRKLGLSAGDRKMLDIQYDSLDDGF
jgi:P27 family predicted phage terminase small subunit